MASRIGGDALVALAETHDFEAVSSDIANAHHRASGHRAALGLEVAAGEAGHHHAKGLAALAKPHHARVQGVRLIGRQPRSETQHPARNRHVDDEADVAGDLGLVRPQAPGDDDLRLGRQEGLGAIELDARVVELGHEHGLALLHAAAAGHVQQGDDRGEQQEADGDRHEQRVVATVQVSD